VIAHQDGADAATARRTAHVKQRALELGFDAVGIAALAANPHAAELDRWLAAGYAGTMRYLERQAARRKDPRRILPHAARAVVTLTNYCHAARPPGSARTGRVAQYARSGDYHHVLGRRLERLATALRALAPGAATRCYVDAGPVPERELAQLAGLGWVGKNMMLLHPELGSFTFIGVVLTDADLATDLPYAADRCGTCRRCLDACPTGAFVAPHVLDARRCIAYLTIEHRGDFSSAEQQMVGEWAFGCDVCQDVCPWNVKFAHPTANPELASRPELAALDLVALLAGDAADFDGRFGDTPLARPGFAGMRRNALAVLSTRHPAQS
jgi:epoxyqueuosine reductase